MVELLQIVDCEAGGLPCESLRQPQGLAGVQLNAQVGNCPGDRGTSADRAAASLLAQRRQAARRAAWRARRPARPAGPRPAPAPACRQRQPGHRCAAGEPVRQHGHERRHDAHGQPAHQQQRVFDHHQPGQHARGENRRPASAPVRRAAPARCAVARSPGQRCPTAVPSRPGFGTSRGRCSARRRTRPADRCSSRRRSHSRPASLPAPVDLRRPARRRVSIRKNR